MAESGRESLEYDQIHTAVSIYLGECNGPSLDVVCDGLSTEQAGSMWKRAFDALLYPSPCGPYPVARAFTIFVHETGKNVIADTRVLTSIRIQVVCEASVVRATLNTVHEARELDELEYLIGDDVVTTARRLFHSVDDSNHALGTMNIEGGAHT